MFKVLTSSKDPTKLLCSEILDEQVRLPRPDQTEELLYARTSGTHLLAYVAPHYHCWNIEDIKVALTTPEVLFIARLFPITEEAFDIAKRLFVLKPAQYKVLTLRNATEDLLLKRLPLKPLKSGYVTFGYENDTDGFMFSVTASEEDFWCALNSIFYDLAHLDVRAGHHYVEAFGPKHGLMVRSTALRELIHILFELQSRGTISRTFKEQIQSK